MGTFGNNFGNNWAYPFAATTTGHGAGATGRPVKGVRRQSLVQTLVKRIAIKGRIIRPRTTVIVKIKAIVIPPAPIKYQVYEKVKRDPKETAQKLLDIAKTLKSLRDSRKKNKKI